MENHLKSVQSLIKEKRLDSLIVTNPTNIFYLTGFSGLSPTEREAILIIKKPKSVLITARLYRTEASRLSTNDFTVKIATERNEYESYINDSLKRDLPAEAFLTSKALASDVAKVGFEANDLKFSEYKKFKNYTKPNKFVPVENLVENLRTIKTEDEMKKIEKAQYITQNAFEQVLKTIKVDQTEAEISDKLTAIMKSLGAGAPAFESIIASGPNSALPHYKTGKRKIRKGDTLLFDFGAKVDNYCADFSRTVFIGKANNTQRKIYDLVQEAQVFAISKIKNKIPAKKIFEISHRVFKKEGVDKYYLHSLGHGVGLEVHESPSLSAKSKDTLQNNMVFSVEPGLYFPWGGVRIEDLVTIEGNHARMLGKTADFIEILT